jgi:hypothetical protein
MMFVGGALIDDENGYTWLELADRKPIHSVRT